MKSLCFGVLTFVMLLMVLVSVVQPNTERKSKPIPTVEIVEVVNHRQIAVSPHGNVDVAIVRRTGNELRAIYLTGTISVSAKAKYLIVWGMNVSSDAQPITVTPFYSPSSD